MPRTFHRGIAMTNSLTALLLCALTLPLAAQTQPSINNVIGLVPEEYRHVLIQRLSQTDDRQPAWLSALATATPDDRDAAAFLLVNMPDRDLKSLAPDFVMRDVKLAIAARDAAPWGASLPHDVFLNDVLPYANLNERRDDWREDFRTRFAPLVKDCKTPGDAAQVLNREVFKALKVAYHATKRKKPDQSPYESCQIGFASCSGLAIILVDACRAVGVPARVAGTPMWHDNSGNHTWVEVWDGKQWRFIGAAEPGPFNQTWFAGSASKADDATPEHRIYAASFRRTSMPFHMVWAPSSPDYSAVDVTPYYVKRHKLTVRVVDALGLPLPSAITVRQGDHLLTAAASGTIVEFELAAGTNYAVEAKPQNGAPLTGQVRIPADADASLDLKQGSKPIASCPVPTESSASPSVAHSDLDGEWAAMRTITPRGYVCTRTAEPIKVDGVADESAWEKAGWTEDFVDIEGSRRPKPRFRTHAKMLWDDHCLYVYAELEEPHVWGTITQKNAVMFLDNDFEMFIDPDGDNHNYYEFEMNALNTVWELTLPKPYREGVQAISPTNIEGLQSAVHVNGKLNDPTDTDHGWSVEIAIPWTGLARYAGAASCPPADGQQWRMNFSRVEWLVDIIDGKYRKIPKEMRAEDNWIWSPQGVIDMHRPERWGFVQFSASSNTATFKPDGTLPTRDALMTVYHRQREFQKRFGRYATTLDELDLSGSPIKLEGAGQNYTASLATKDGQTWHVRQDSRLWKE